jgi:hypothetical protein
MLLSPPIQPTYIICNPAACQVIESLDSQLQPLQSIAATRHFDYDPPPCHLCFSAPASKVILVLPCPALLLVPILTWLQLCILLS